VNRIGFYRHASRLSTAYFIAFPNGPRRSCCTPGAGGESESDSFNPLRGRVVPENGRVNQIGRICLCPSSTSLVPSFSLRICSIVMLP
jgi:hypothetical protein